MMTITGMSNKQVESAIKRIDHMNKMPNEVRAGLYLSAAMTAYENGMEVTSMKQLGKARTMLEVDTLVRRDLNPIDNRTRFSTLLDNRKRIGEIGEITKMIMDKEKVDWSSFNIRVLRKQDVEPTILEQIFLPS